jgi:hypothetical protein
MRSKWRVLWVTRIRPAPSACAAIRVSIIADGLTALAQLRRDDAVAVCGFGWTGLPGKLVEQQFSGLIGQDGLEATNPHCRLNPRRLRAHADF